MPEHAVPTTHPSTSRTLSVGGRQLRVDVRPGDPTRTPLLMFGGIGASLEVLQPLVDTLDPDIEVIRVDPPGVGGSPTSVLPYSFPDLAWAMTQLLDQLGHGTVDVLGYSWGGALAQQFALQSSRRTRRLVLVSTSPGFLGVPGEPRVLSHLLVPRNLTDAADAAVLNDLLQRRVPPAAESGAATGNSAAGIGYLQQLVALSCWTSLPFLPWLSRPTLILNGDDDPIVPSANASLMAAAIPGATVQVFPGGHLEIVVAAADIGRRVSAFLA